MDSYLNRIVSSHCESSCYAFFPLEVKVQYREAYSPFAFYLPVSFEGTVVLEMIKRAFLEFGLYTVSPGRGLFAGSVFTPNVDLKNFAHWQECLKTRFFATERRFGASEFDQVAWDPKVHEIVSGGTMITTFRACTSFGPRHSNELLVTR